MFEINEFYKFKNFISEYLIGKNIKYVMKSGPTHINYYIFDQSKRKKYISVSKKDNLIYKFDIVCGALQDSDTWKNIFL